MMTQTNSPRLTTCLNLRATNNPSMHSVKPASSAPARPSFTAPLVQADTISTKAVIETYVNIAHASFDDALTTAKILQDKIKDAKVSETLVGKLADTQQKVEAIVTAAKNGEHFDQQITADNKDGNKRIKAAIAALRSQTGDIEAAAKVLGIDNLNPENSESFGG